MLQLWPTSKTNSRRTIALIILLFQKEGSQLIYISSLQESGLTRFVEAVNCCYSSLVASMNIWPPTMPHFAIWLCLNFLPITGYHECTLAPSTGSHQPCHYQKRGQARCACDQIHVKHLMINLKFWIQSKIYLQSKMAPKGTGRHKSCWSRDAVACHQSTQSPVSLP